MPRARAFSEEELADLPRSDEIDHNLGPLFAFRLNHAKILSKASKHLRSGKPPEGDDFRRVVAVIGALTPEEGERRLGLVFDRLDMTRLVGRASVRASFPLASLLGFAVALAQEARPPWEASLLRLVEDLRGAAPPVAPPPGAAASEASAPGDPSEAESRAGSISSGSERRGDRHRPSERRDHRRPPMRERDAKRRRLDRPTSEASSEEEPEDTDEGYFRTGPYRLALSPAQRLRERLQEWRERHVPADVSRKWINIHRELEVLLFHEAAEVARVHVRGSGSLFRRKYEWTGAAKANSALVVMALPTVRRLGDVVIQLLEMESSADFRSRGVTEGGVMDEDTLTPARVAAWRRFGAHVPRDLPGERSLPAPSRMTSDGFLWWGILLAETDPDFLLEALAECAHEYEREFRRRMGGAVVSYLEWKRSRPELAGGSGGGVAANPAPGGVSRNQRRLISRRRGSAAAGRAAFGPASSHVWRATPPQAGRSAPIPVPGARGPPAPPR